MEQTFAGSGTSREPQPNPHRGTPAMSKARKARSPRAAVIERSGAAMNRAAVLCDHRRREFFLAQMPGVPLILARAARDVLCPRTISSPQSLEFRSPHARSIESVRRRERSAPLPRHGTTLLTVGPVT